MHKVEQHGPLAHVIAQANCLTIQGNRLEVQGGLTYGWSPALVGDEGRAPSGCVGALVEPKITLRGLIVQVKCTLQLLVVTGPAVPEQDGARQQQKSAAHEQPIAEEWR